MKKTLIIFVVLFIITLITPLISLFEQSKDSKNEIVTIFNSADIIEWNCH